MDQIASALPSIATAAAVGVVGVLWRLNVTLATVGARLTTIAGHLDDHETRLRAIEQRGG